jgi:DNA-binding MarR family transcriptional regulator
MLDSLESDGWIYTAVHARGVAERVSITPKGRELVERMTARREREIDAILRRMTDTSRDQLTRAFTTFAAAAGEQTVDRPRKGIAP